ncbi:MAG: hypothetical protein GY754_17805 [bacterium]|nr:hypothetical protein [bacterium]
MSQTPSHIEIATYSIRVFADDGTIDMEELNFLMGLALRDHVIDDNESRIISSVFKQVGQNDVSASVWDRIQEIKKKYNIS